MKDLILLDLFSGTGGFPLGLKQAGFDFKKHYFSEIDTYTIANYSNNFKNAIYAGPIENIKKGQIEKPDIVTFGSPCQDLSIAGKQKGIKGSKSRLFLKQLESSTHIIPVCLSLKTSKDFSPVTRAKTLKSYLNRLPPWDL